MSPVGEAKSPDQTIYGVFDELGEKGRGDGRRRGQYVIRRARSTWSTRMGSVRIAERAQLRVGCAAGCGHYVTENCLCGIPSEILETEIELISHFTSSRTFVAHGPLSLAGPAGLPLIAGHRGGCRETPSN